MAAMVIWPASSPDNIEGITETFVVKEGITLNIWHDIIVMISVLVEMFKQL